ncbi:hypothetical protein H5410_014457 [Solanum commersonii]|uniref:Uncharacterized protein n=1 Tax=Solanum commersonii TaxID=4109 RepID=A0A9J5ZR02_SOLCO|nr:hypothetical protein H5410_014457 [Solanum commersonii]
MIFLKHYLLNSDRDSNLYGLISRGINIINRGKRSNGWKYLDNWTSLGAVKSTHPDFISAPNIKESKFFMDSSGWNREKLHQYLPELVVEHSHKKLQYKYLFELSNHL